MSNRSAQRRPTKPSFMDALKKAAEDQTNSEPEDVGIPEPSGTLPTPNAQRLEAQRIQWDWSGEKYTVTATYDRVIHNYTVEPFCEDGESFNADEAKEFGEALLAAWQYQYTWQQHVGEFLIEADTLPVAPYPGQSPGSAEALDGQ